MTHSAFRSLLLGAALAGAATTPLAARPHNGLGQYLQVIGYDGTWPDWVVNNSSALSFGAMGNLPALTSAGEIDGILRQIDQPYAVSSTDQPRRDIDTFYGTDTGSRDGHHPATRGTWEAYAFGQWNTGDFDHAPNGPIYNPKTWGGLLGLQRWVDDERLVGATVSYNFNRADIHDDGGRIEGDEARLRLYAALIPEGQPWWLVFGASGGYVGYDSKRNNPLDGKLATASPDGYEVGVFAALNARLTLAEGLDLTPIARFDYNNTRIGKFTEGGPSNYALDVTRFNTVSYQTRLGAGLEYIGDLGGDFLHLGCSVVWASELGGNDTDIRNSFVNYPGSKHTIYANQLFGDAVEITPTVSLVLANGIVLQAAYQVQITFDAQFSQTATGSIGWRF